MNRYPIYIPSKGRADCHKTPRFLREMGIPFKVIVEKHQYEDYRRSLTDEELLILPVEYKEAYRTLDEYGLEKSTGSGPARNFAWEHSIERGYRAHWIMDDNICGFYRFNRNLKVPCKTPVFFGAQEDFFDRYENLGMCGPNYFMFITRKIPPKRPFTINTRIYSCNLIRNDLPLRWRGRYNEDTILSLDILSMGLCTVLFNAFLQDKMTTQYLKGGNTEELYRPEGTLPKSEMLKNQYPHITEVVQRFGREHHYVNYKVFKQGLVFKEGVKPPEGVNEYGMVLEVVDQ